MYTVTFMMMQEAEDKIKFITTKEIKTQKKKSMHAHMHKDLDGINGFHLTFLRTIHMCEEEQFVEP